MTAALAGLVVACGRSNAVVESSPQPIASSSAALGARNAEPEEGAIPATKPPVLSREEPDRLVILAGGDVGLGRWVGQRILQSATYDPFAHVRPWFDSADLVLVNLESQLSDQDGQTVHPANYLVFTGPPAGASLLQKAGVDYVSVANNHAWDYGKGAFFETLTHLGRAKIAHSGGSRVPNERYRPVVLHHEDWSVAVFAVTHIWNQPPYNEHPGRHHVAWASHAALAKPLREARREHDVVLVNYHGGGEYIDRPLPRTTRFYDQTLDSGVDAVIGHHPHVPQGIRFTNGRPGFYSLGNLVFEPFYSEWTRTGLLVRLTFERDAPGMPAVVDVCPVTIEDDDLPRPFTSLEPQERDERYAALRARLLETSGREGAIEVGEPDPLGCMRVSSAPRRAVP